MNGLVTPWSRLVRRVGGWLLPADTAAGRYARRYLARFAPGPAPEIDDVRPTAGTAAAESSAELLTRPPLAVPDARVRVIVEQLLQDPGGVLTFPSESSPTVSIVLTTCDSVHNAYRCLESVLAHAGAGHELVVVDDHSTDRTDELLTRLRNATHLRRPAKLGSIKARNVAAERASGSYLLLLNQDVALGPGSVAALLETIEADGSCGAVGGKLVLPNGRVQAAGGVVWRDGALQAYAAGADPFAPETSYAREVDFCSGAFLLVRKALFDRLGGFDEGFVPGCDYEAADLCMEIRRLGYRVRFAPGAIAFPCEVPCSSPDEAAVHARNHDRFAHKWKAELDSQPDPSSSGLLAARDRADGPRVLVVDDRIPDASRGAGYPRAHALLESLADLGYRVTFFPYGDGAPYQPWLRDLQRAGVEAMVGGIDFAQFAAERTDHYDALIVSRPINFRQVRPLLDRFFTRAGIVYDAEALWFLREKTKAGVEGVPWTDPAAEEEELALLRGADLVVTVSDHEKRVATAAVPEIGDRIHVWGHPVRLRPTRRAFGDRKDLLFVGGFHASPSPNEDAVLYFVREVLPRVRSRLDCTLHVVGYGAAEALSGCVPESVRVTGRVEDLTEWYEGCRVFVVPHRYSAGIPLKLCEAMGRGVPAVVTELIAAQIGAEDRREVLVGRSAEELADRVVELYGNERLWTSLRENALAFVGRRHDPDALQADLDAIVRTAISAR